MRDEAIRLERFLNGAFQLEILHQRLVGQPKPDGSLNRHRSARFTEELTKFADGLPQEERLVLLEAGPNFAAEMDQVIASEILRVAVLLSPQDEIRRLVEEE